jgi:hypothetical protein
MGLERHGIKRLHEDFAGATKRRGGHALQMENPAGIAQVLLDFVAQVLIG